MRILLIPLILLLVHVATLACGAENRPQVDIITDKGTIRCTLFADEAPKTVANFIALADGTKEWTDPKTGEKKTAPFYDGLTFHRVIPGFMIQGGCPLGDGSSGPGYTFQDEINAKSLGLDTEMALKGQELHPWCQHMSEKFFRAIIQPRLAAKGITQATPQQQHQDAVMAMLPTLQNISLQEFYEAFGFVYDATLSPSHRPLKGMLAMANSGPNTNGSQFFINLDDTPHLTGQHTVFGEITSGQEVVAAIGAKPTTPGGPTVKILRIRSVPASP